MLTLLLFVLGLVLLIVGADVLVRGAARLAVTIGLPPLVVGLTVVAFGTSAPEMAVSVQSALRGDGGADIAIGNVIGSNICNVLLILGLSASVAPLIVSRNLVRIDVPIMIGASLLAWFLMLDGRLGFWDGFILFAGIIAYTAFAVVQGRKEGRDAEEKASGELGELAKPRARGGVAVDIVLVVAGLAMLVLGSTWLVESASAIARVLGVDELLIGLTIVAIGTSLPELATSVVASIKGERDLAVGNVIGSNLFNILAVLGLAGLVAPEGVAVAASVLRVDFPIMMAVMIACLPIFFTGYTISRWEGFVFVGYYAAYMLLLYLTATDHGGLAAYQSAMFFFVIPLTALTLAVSVYRHLRQKKPSMRT